MPSDVIKTYDDANKCVWAKQFGPLMCAKSVALDEGWMNDDYDVINFKIFTMKVSEAYGIGIVIKKNFFHFWMARSPKKKIDLRNTKM